jgi:hypothetical protein
MCFSNHRRSHEQVLFARAEFCENLRDLFATAILAI